MGIYYNVGVIGGDYLNLQEFFQDAINKINKYNSAVYLIDEVNMDYLYSHKFIINNLVFEIIGDKVMIIQLK